LTYAENADMEVAMATRFTVVDRQGDRSKFTIKDSSNGSSGTYIKGRQISGDAKAQARWESNGELMLTEDFIGPGLPKRIFVLVLTQNPEPPMGLPVFAAWGGGTIFEYILKETS
jgi:hypothetical protein